MSNFFSISKRTNEPSLEVQYEVHRRRQIALSRPCRPDTLYVTPLLGPLTVNTMPLETIEAFRDHGVVDCRAVMQGLDQAHREMQDLERAGISMKTVTDELIREGVEKFCQALHALLDTIEKRQGIVVRA